MYVPLERFSLNFTLEHFSKIYREKFKFKHNLTRITGNLHEDQYTFLIISRSVLLIMRNVSQKSCRENQNTQHMFNNLFLKIVPFIR